MDAPIGKDLTNSIIGKQFRLVKKIGSGAFGEIYLVQKNNKEEFAMKLERSDQKHAQLFFEAKLYNYLQGSDPSDKGNEKSFTLRKAFPGFRLKAPTASITIW